MSGDAQSLPVRVRRRILEHIERLADPDQEVAARAENILIRYYRDRVFELVLPTCSHPSPMARLRAGWVVGHTGRAEAFEVLRLLCDDPDPRVRYDTRVVLGTLGGEESIALLAAHIDSGDDELGASWMGLGKVGDAAMDHARRLASHEDNGMRFGTVRLLFCIAKGGNSDAVDALKLLADDPCEFVRDEARDFLNELTVASGL